MADFEYQITVRMAVDPRFYVTEHQRSGLEAALAATMTGTMLMKPVVSWEDRHYAVVVLRGVNTDAEGAKAASRRLVERNAAQQGIYVASTEIVDIFRSDDWPRKIPMNEGRDGLCQSQTFC